MSPASKNKSDINLKTRIVKFSDNLPPPPAAVILDVSNGRTTFGLIEFDIFKYTGTEVEIIEVRPFIHDPKNP